MNKKLVSSILFVLSAHYADAMDYGKNAIAYVSKLYAQWKPTLPTPEEVDSVKAQERQQGSVVCSATGYDAHCGKQKDHLLAYAGEAIRLSSLGVCNKSPDDIAYLTLGSPQPTISFNKGKEQLDAIQGCLTNGQELCFSKDDEFFAQKFQKSPYPDYADSVRIYSAASKKSHTIEQNFTSRLRWNRAEGKNLLAVICAAVPKYVGEHNVRVYEVQQQYVHKVSEFDHESANSGWACRWHPIQNILQVARNNDKATFALVRASSGQSEGEVKMSQHCVDDSCFCNDGTCLAISAGNFGEVLNNNVLAVYAVATLQQSLSIPLKASALIAGWNSQGILIQSNHKNVVDLYDVKTGHLVRSYEGPYQFGHVDMSRAAMSPDGQKMFMATPDALKIVDVGMGKTMDEFCRDVSDFALLNPTWNCNSSAVLYTRQGMSGYCVVQHSIQDTSAYDPALCYQE